MRKNNEWDWFTNNIRNHHKNNIDLNVIFEGAHLFPGYSRGTGEIWNLNNSTKSHGNIILNFLDKHTRLNLGKIKLLLQLIKYIQCNKIWSRSSYLRNKASQIFLDYCIIITKKILVVAMEHPARASSKRIHSEKPCVTLLNEHHKKVYSLTLVPE